MKVKFTVYVELKEDLRDELMDTVESTLKDYFPGVTRVICLKDAVVQRMPK